VIRLRYPLALLGLAVALAVPLVVLLLRNEGASGGSFRGSVPPTGVRLPAFRLRDAAGRAVTSADLKGKAAVVTFLDTACREQCPIVAGQIARGMALLSAKERPDVKALAITVDPERDSPVAVRAFLRRHGAGGSLDYLIGTRARLRPIWKRFAVQPVMRGANANIHSDPVRIYDRSGEWVSTLAAGFDLTPANFAHDVRRALST
jgi:protein SCO1/2